MGASVIRNVPKEFSIVLDLKRPVSNTDFEVVEGDTENYINITLTDDGEAVNIPQNKVVAVFTHSKGSFIQSSDDNKGGITVSGNVIRLHLLTGSFSVGMVECELRIYGEPMSLSTTPVFNFSCRASLLSDDTVAAQNNLDLLTGLISQVHTALNTAQSCVEEYATIPFIDVVYSNTEPSQLSHSALSKTPGEYMGIFCSSSGRPTDVSDYTWVHLAQPPHVTAAQINSSDELTFTLSDNSTIQTTGLSAAIAQRVNTAAQNIPKVVSATVSTNGTMQLGLSDSSTLTVQNSASVIGSMVNTAVSSIAPVTARNVTVSPNAFTPSDMFRSYGYSAAVPCMGMRPEYTGSVTFSADDADKGIFSSVAVAGTDCVYIFSKLIPDDDVTILMVKGEK